jgi:molecular chaperone GrpE
VTEKSDQDARPEGTDEDEQQAVNTASADGATPAAEVDRELEQLEHALGTTERELAETKESMLRMHAEMENLRKRLIKDLERSRRRALEDIMLDLLPVKDSLERGMESDETTTTVEAMKEGKALIIRMLGKVMNDHGLQEVDPVGEAFNPELHQAMAMHESDEHEPGTVIEVVQKGFQLHDRLIRPAMVIVAKAPEEN